MRRAARPLNLARSLPARWVKPFTGMAAQGQTGKRPANEIGYHAVRTGDNPGEHTIVFGLLGETLEITVKASSRDCYALGALAAAKFVAARSRDCIRCTMSWV